MLDSTDGIMRKSTMTVVLDKQQSLGLALVPRQPTLEYHNIAQWGD